MYARDTGKGAPLSMGASGALWRDSLVLYDRESGTYWSQVNGEAIRGKRKGEKLEALPARVMTWSAWKELHPDTLVLVKDPAIARSQYAGYVTDPNKLGISGKGNHDPRLHGKEMVLGITRNGKTTAISYRALREARIVQITVGGEKVVAVHTGGDAGVTVYLARAGGVDLDFASGGSDPVAARDSGTGSTWDLIRGVATHGPLAGTSLTEINSLFAYWFIWSRFYPETEVWNSEASSESPD